MATCKLLTYSMPCCMEEMWKELSKTPSVFTLQVSGPLDMGRLKSIKTAMEEELATLEQIQITSYECDMEEIAQSLDFLTWLEYKIGCKRKALELNDRALATTNSKSVFSLGNRAHLMWNQDKTERTRDCLSQISRLMKESSEKGEVASISAHQASEKGEVASISAHQASEKGEVVSISAHQASEKGEVASISAHQASEKGEVVSISAHQASEKGEVASISAHQASEKGEVASISAHQASEKGEVASISAHQASEKGEVASISAHQAYCYLRLGGLKNLLMAAALYEKALKLEPNCHLWRSQAGRVYKRLAHPNMLKKGEVMDRELKTQREQTARSYFLTVSNNSRNPRLRAFAFSDLASMANVQLKRTSRFRAQQVQQVQQVRQLCEKALANNCQYSYVLVNCGKSLINIDISWATELLTKASNLGPCSHVLSQLATCYRNLSYKEKRNPDLQKQYVDEAERRYRDAIELAPSNLPARYSLAKLLLDSGKVKEAKNEFTNIIRTIMTCEHQGYAQTVMKAYEQIALCLLHLSHDTEYLANLPPSMTESSVKTEAEAMLIQALEMGFSLLGRQEIKQYLCNSLNSLLYISSRKQGIPEALQLVARVFRLAKEPTQSLQVLDQLLTHVTPNDPGTVISVIKSYYDLHSFERAYALLQVSSSLTESFCVDQHFQQKVSLSTAHARLQYGNIQVVRIFKSQFDQFRHRHHCVQPAGAEGGQSPGDDDPDDSEPLDVLIFYDESGDSSRGPSALSSICRKLEQSMGTMFGLNVSRNVQRCCDGRPQMAFQCEEITKAKVVLVVVGPDAMGNYFRQFLEYLPSLSIQDEDNPRPPRILLAPTEHGVKLPSPMSNIFPKTPLVEPFIASLQIFLNCCLEKKAKSYMLPPEQVDENVKKSVEDIMSFYCCLIATDWPLPADQSSNSTEAVPAKFS